jgi:hypothetical protein
LTAAGANRPKCYKKGPDVGSKSRQSKYRYKSLLKDQKTLENLGFTKVIKPDTSNDDSEDSSESDSSGFGEETFEVCEYELRRPLTASNKYQDVVIKQESQALEISIPDAPLGKEDMDIRSDSGHDSVQIRFESATPPRLLFDDKIDPGSSSQSSRDPVRESTTLPWLFDDDDPNLTDEEWEAELDECLAPNSTEIRDWSTLREQIKRDLARKYKSLPLSQVNQFMILRNFATLHLRGLGRIDASKEIARQFHQKLEGSSDHFARRIRSLARHYQIFEQLPRERRGGIKNARSILKNEGVRRASRAWLMQQRKGKVTPVKFQKGLNEIILPSLSIYPSKPLCERTARRWLVKLGWQRTKIKKGVYIDGHERADVVSYRQNDFLPKMAVYECQMAKYERVGDVLQRIAPTLQPGEQELIPEFHDESSFQAFEHTTSVW